MSGEKFSAMPGEIELVCSYIKDDQTVANYFGISRQRVEHARSQLPPRKAWVPYYDQKRLGLGMEADKIALKDAVSGSRNLNEAIQSLFSRWEEKHGFQEGAAKVLLPAGYSPDRRAA